MAQLETLNSELGEIGNVDDACKAEIKGLAQIAPRGVQHVLAETQQAADLAAADLPGNHIARTNGQFL